MRIADTHLAKGHIAYCTQDLKWPLLKNRIFRTFIKKKYSTIYALVDVLLELVITRVFEKIPSYFTTRSSKRKSDTKEPSLHHSSPINGCKFSHLVCQCEFVLRLSVYTTIAIENQSSVRIWFDYLIENRGDRIDMTSHDSWALPLRDLHYNGVGRRTFVIFST